MRVIIYDTAELNSDLIFQREYAEVYEERREKIDRIRSRDGKNMSLGAGILEKRFGVLQPCFNLSHSHGMAVIAVSGSRVGVDIEPVRKANISVARRFFCPGELQYVLENGDTGFFRIWTLKEAFMKATGKGMALGLDSFCIDISDNKVSVRQDFDNGGWIFSEFRQGDFLVAVCGKESVEKLETFVL